MEEPSTEGEYGTDLIMIELSDGTKYQFNFDYFDQLEHIFEDGPDPAAESYFNAVSGGIDSGSARVDDFFLDI